MKLLTKEIEKKLPKLYVTEEVSESEKVLICKFFDPCSQWTWFATEGEWQEFEDGTKDFMFFGYVVGNEREWGYFSLNELSSVKNRFGLGIERDRYFDPIKFKDCSEIR